MAKKKNPGENNHGHVNDDMEQLRQISEQYFDTLDVKERSDFFSMMQCALAGITPEEYEEFYKMFEFSGRIAEQFAGVMPDDEDDDEMPDFPFTPRRPVEKGAEPLEDAADKTLVLKIQLAGVTKPPMWREVEIPADFNFLQLHETIQDLTGLEDYHLWQFNRRAYNSSLAIGNENLEDATHDAEDTPLTAFLREKGNKLESVYDFGDDWIFTIEVKDVLDRKSDRPVCTKFKGELNAMEDFGGIPAYMALRDALEDFKSAKPAEKKKIARNFGFDSTKEFQEFIDDHTFNLNEVNVFLYGI